MKKSFQSLASKSPVKTPTIYAAVQNRYGDDDGCALTLLIPDDKGEPAWYTLGAALPNDTVFAPGTKMSDIQPGTVLKISLGAQADDNGVKYNKLARIKHLPGLSIQGPHIDNDHPVGRLEFLKKGSLPANSQADLDANNFPRVEDVLAGLQRQKPPTP
ncbi:MAG: hypothetical protein OXT65_06235 [Alphaproteobacteria bacterium]|nr:hypothetical protein [Alphaproteobacteria bacterium]